MPFYGLRRDLEKLTALTSGNPQMSESEVVGTPIGGPNRWKKCTSRGFFGLGLASFILPAMPELFAPNQLNS